MQQTRYRALCLLSVFLLFCLLGTSGCLPVIAAVGATGGWVSADPEAQSSFSHFFDDLNRSTRYSRRRTRRSIPPPAYGPRRRLSLALDRFSVTPRRVHPGQNITIKMEYTIRGAPSTGLEIVDRKFLWFGDKKIGKLGDVKKERQENGSWVSELTIKVPETADNGKYRIEQELVSPEGVGISKTGYFFVYRE